MSLALLGLAFPPDHSAAAPATTGQQLPSVYEGLFPEDELIDSTILYEPGHRASNYLQVKCLTSCSSAESREHGMLSVTSMTVSFWERVHKWQTLAYACQEHS